MVCVVRISKLGGNVRADYMRARLVKTFCRKRGFGQPVQLS
jgi:hypothetical protein